MSQVNILVMIHGIIPDDQPKSHAKEYRDFFQALKDKEPQLSSLFPHPPITVEWGHELPGEQDIPSDRLQNDRKLTRTQNFINQKINYKSLREDKDPNNVTITDFTWLPPIRNAIMDLREQLFIRGLGDVIYYASEDGEAQIRQVVYSTVLEGLDRYLDRQDVRIHVITHSLGVTIGHDFLFGLFAPNHQTRFIAKEQGDEISIERYQKWRDKAQSGSLKLGSFTSTASQIPIFTMRRQDMVNKLAAGESLKAADIGIVAANLVKWKLFYDVDDVLAYGTRSLYDNKTAIKEIQVDNNDNPITVHNQYWTNKRVIEETAQLLLTNAR